jgi:hypothetical protein
LEVLPVRRPLLLVLAAALLATPGVAHAGKPTGGGTTTTLPSSMSSIGDSITRGFNACGWYVDCTSASWATGTDTSINSHYLRILAKNRNINGRNYNDARSGARRSTSTARRRPRSPAASSTSRS